MSGYMHFSWSLAMLSLPFALVHCIRDPTVICRMGVCLEAHQVGRGSRNLLVEYPL
jgi:hypothetical protein